MVHAEILAKPATNSIALLDNAETQRFSAPLRKKRSMLNAQTIEKAGAE